MLKSKMGKIKGPPMFKTVTINPGIYNNRELFGLYDFSVDLNLLDKDENYSQT